LAVDSSSTTEAIDLFSIDPARESPAGRQRSFHKGQYISISPLWQLISILGNYLPGRAICHLRD
jgi:hypothetical protein